MCKDTKHIPERSCVICKAKKNKKNFLRIIKSGAGYVYDATAKAQTRGQYICYDLNCLNKLSKHKKYKLSSDSLILMLNAINKKNKNYVSILEAMKNSGELVFGMNMISEEVKKINLLIIATDISKKNEAKLLQYASDYNIEVLHISNKKELGNIFSKDEINVIGIKNKKMARGLRGC